MPSSKSLFPPRVVVSLLACAHALTLGGCLAVAVGGATGGTVAYVRGDNEAVVDAPLEDAREAAVAALEDLGLTIISNEGDETVAKVVARNVEDKKVVVSMKAQTDRTTQISVRFGTFGDEEQSNRVLLRVQERL